MSTVYIQNVDVGISLNAADMDGVWWLDISSTDVEVEKVESDVSETTFTRSEDVCSVCHSLGSVSLRLDCMAGRSMS